jgi:hypothetical protein
MWILTKVTFVVGGERLPPPQRLEVSDAEGERAIALGLAERAAAPAGPAPRGASLLPEAAPKRKTKPAKRPPVTDAG